MRYYPVHLDIRNRKCLVVGGGDVGERKVSTLLDCGGVVTVVSPSVTASLRKLAEGGRITLHMRAYRTTDLVGMFIVIGATDDEVLNLKIYKDAGEQKVLCNIVDQPEACNFILPSIVHRGALVITVSTSGKSPAFARKLRLDLEKRFGMEYAEFLDLMGAVRYKLLNSGHELQDRKDRFEALIAGGLAELIRKQDKAGINRLLDEVLGGEYDYDELMT